MLLTYNSRTIGGKVITDRLMEGVAEGHLIQNMPKAVDVHGFKGGDLAVLHEERSIK